MLEYLQLSKFLDWFWRYLLTFSVKFLILSQEERNNLEIELKESSFSKQGRQNQLISDHWRYLYVFCQVCYKKYGSIYCTDHNRLLYAFWQPLFDISRMTISFVVVMAWSKISSDDSMGIVASVFITQF